MTYGSYAYRFSGIATWLRHARTALDQPVPNDIDGHRAFSRLVDEGVSRILRTGIALRL